MLRLTHLLPALTGRLRRGGRADADAPAFAPHPEPVVTRSRVLLRFELLAKELREAGADDVARKLERFAKRHARDDRDAELAEQARALLDELRDDPATPAHVRDLLVLPADLAAA